MFMLSEAFTMTRSTRNLHTAISILAYAALYPNTVKAFDNGVGRLPAMGFNAWNAYACNVNESLIVQTAQDMQKLGLQDVGYTQINLDDCWALRNRSSTGEIQSDPTRFPDMTNLTSTLHDMGYKAGIYSDSGWFTCAGFAGSFEHEEQDALTFQSWGFDFLKYDNCAIPFDDVIREGMVGKYQRMSDALVVVSQQTGTDFVFSLCQWGWNQVWLWGASLSHSWRIDGDIEANWDSLASIINTVSFITQATNFYGRNDLDMLEIGNGNLTYDESKTHFTAWALVKAPLLIGTDVATLTQQNVEILSNQEIIAINQDSVYGTSISPFRWGINADFTFNTTFPAQYWSGPSENGTVFMLINTLSEPADMFFNLTESPWTRAGIQYSVRDLWTHTDNGTAVRNFTAYEVPSHGVVALLMQQDGPEPPGLMPLCAGEAESQCTAENGTSVG
ncbi:glycoside hydrolase family 27 protein [Serpula lacrymans var. lacrymans S7.3]|uniref:Alpha-galactosidase n=2 Tax=Serpula lacrymans var. lacrymans TaxID=341189 RepID=F8PKX7_SERL3|nr:glycoside hydrolase family 27 protein [Serpula lacrymans var. lacrymans S7.9]EGO03621.1 glycoside hydrolase family 27 protein [Serpula lacrymans var. lacrymans S7.3]EGO29491.1 glycoside hydrolase family 27 protein [Serpula lacrymans var. lacrymans S7.9]